MGVGVDGVLVKLGLTQQILEVPGIMVGVAVREFLGDGVAVGETVLVVVFDGVPVAVFVAVGVGVTVRVQVRVAVGETVKVWEISGVGVEVGVTVTVGVSGGSTDGKELLRTLLNRTASR